MKATSPTATAAVVDSHPVAANATTATIVQTAATMVASAPNATMVASAPNATIVQVAPMVASAPNATVLQAPRDLATAEAKSDSVWPMLQRCARVPMPLMNATCPLECCHPNLVANPLRPPFASCFSIAAHRDGELVCARRHCGMLARRTHRPSPLPRCPHRLPRLHWMMNSILLRPSAAFSAAACLSPSLWVLGFHISEASLDATAAVLKPMIWVAASPWPSQHLVEEED